MCNGCGTHLVIQVVVQVVPQQQVHERLLAYGVVAEDRGAVQAEQRAVHINQGRMHFKNIQEINFALCDCLLQAHSQAWRS